MRFVVALVFSVLLLGSAPALATPTISLLWDSTGTSDVVVSDSLAETLQLNIVLSMDSFELLGEFVYEVEFDLSPSLFTNELNFVSLNQPPVLGLPGLFVPTDIFLPGSPSTVESTGAGSGLVSDLGYTAAGAGPAIGPFSALVGQIVFQTNPANVGTDGVDVLPTFAPGAGGVFDNLFTAYPIVNLEGASVNVVPEPGTGILLGAGLALLARRGNQSRPQKGNS